MPYVGVDETAMNLLGADLHTALQMSHYEATSGNSSSKQQQQQVNYNRYKTELCRQFSESGDCKYGDKCQFAHGFHELKDVKRHPRYKTDLCKTFHSKGFCPYGPRCHFIHEIAEKRDQLKKETPLSPLKVSRALVRPSEQLPSELHVNQLAKTVNQLSMSDEFSFSSCGSSNASSGSVSPTSSSFSSSSSPFYAFSLSSAFELPKSPEKSAQMKQQPINKWSSSASTSSTCSTRSSASLLKTKMEPSPLKAVKCQLNEDNAFLNAQMYATNDHAQFFETNVMDNFNRTSFHNDFFVPQAFYDSWKVSGECDWPLSSEIAANSQNCFSAAYQFHETKIR